MEVYTIDKKKYSFNTKLLFNQGFFGKIYLTKDNKCLKIFKEPIKRDDIKDFEEDTYNEIRSLKLKNFYELYDLYYDKTLTQILGYLSKYYQEEDADILTMPTDYTLDNLCSLYNSFKTLSEHNICTNDIHSGNVIMNGNGITIIDVDLYYKCSYETSDTILRKNICNLSDLFIDIYLSGLENYDKYNRFLLADKIQRLFLINSTYGIEPVIKKLIKYKYPIDYLRKR